MFELNIKTNKKEEIIDITSKVEDLIKEVKDGVVLVYVPHTTVGITINENTDINVKKDLLKALRHIVPENLGYEHSEGNSSSHIKSTLVGNSVNVIVKNGKLQLGTWGGIMFCEFDGPRERKVYVKVY
jgi:secondary thiamine-phosphate synthase enzyme